MQYHELYIKLHLKAPVHFQKSLEPLSKLVSAALYRADMDMIHSAYNFKHYVFSNLLTRSPDKVYQPGDNAFLLRSPKEELVKNVAEGLLGYEDNIFRIVSIGLKTRKIEVVEGIISLNPVVASFTNAQGRRRYWTVYEEKDIDFLLRALHNNLLKKYHDLYKEELSPEENFIEFLELKNQKPVAMHYKGGKIYGNKLFIRPKNDEISQKLACLAVAEGLGEKNPLGYGFCNRIKATA